MNQISSEYLFETLSFIQKHSANERNLMVDELQNKSLDMKDESKLEILLLFQEYHNKSKDEIKQFIESESSFDENYKARLKHKILEYLLKYKIEENNQKELILKELKPKLMDEIKDELEQQLQDKNSESTKLNLDVKLLNKKEIEQNEIYESLQENKIKSLEESQVIDKDELKESDKKKAVDQIKLLLDKDKIKQKLLDELKHEKESSLTITLKLEELLLSEQTKIECSEEISKLRLIHDKEVSLNNEIYLLTQKIGEKENESNVFIHNLNLEKEKSIHSLRLDLERQVELIKTLQLSEREMSITIKSLEDNHENIEKRVIGIYHEKLDNINKENESMKNELVTKINHIEKEKEQLL